MGQREVIEWLKKRREMGDDEWYGVNDICKGMKKDDELCLYAKYHGVCMAILRIRSDMTKNNPLQWKRKNKLTARSNWMVYRYRLKDECGAENGA